MIVFDFFFFLLNQIHGSVLSTVKSEWLGIESTILHSIIVSSALTFWNMILAKQQFFLNTFSKIRILQWFLSQKLLILVKNVQLTLLVHFDLKIEKKNFKTVQPSIPGAPKHREKIHEAIDPLAWKNNYNNATMLKRRSVSAGTRARRSVVGGGEES